MKKTLMIATVAALALGAGSAMAQDGPSPQDYWASKNLEAVTRQAAPRNDGNSVGNYHSFLLHANPVHNDAGFIGGDGSGS